MYLSIYPSIYHAIYRLHLGIGSISGQVKTPDQLALKIPNESECIHLEKL